MGFFRQHPRLCAAAAAMAIFVTVSLVFMAPQLEGRILSMHDDWQYVGMSQDIREHNSLYGEDPQWTGNAFSGMPSYQNSIKYPAMIIHSAENALHRAVGDPAWMLMAAMACFWIMLLLWGVGPWTAIGPAVAYGLSTYSILIIGAGHLAKMCAFAYAPLLLGGIRLTLYGRRRLPGAALTALAASLELAAGHPQITYYFLMVAAAMWIGWLVERIRSKEAASAIGPTLWLAAAALLAVGSNLSSTYYTMRLAPYTTRGGSELTEEGDRSGTLDLDYATAWSYGRWETMNLLIPDFKGGGSAAFSDDGDVSRALRPYGISAAEGPAYGISTYWGEQPGTAGPTYLGASVLLLALLALLVIKPGDRWWILAVSVIAVLLSWGSNMMWLTRLAFGILPGYGKFRAVATILVIVQWSAPLLAALAVDRLCRGEVRMRDLLKAAVPVAAVLLAAALSAGAMMTFAGPYDSTLPDDIVAAMRAERQSMLVSDALRSLLLAALTAGAAALLIKRRISSGVFIALSCLIMTADLWGVDRRYMGWDSFVDRSAKEHTPREADSIILQDTEPGFRVADMSVSTFSDATASYFHRSVGGYHGAKLQRYQDIIDTYLSKGDVSVYSMLNTKYFIVPSQETGKAEVQINPDRNGAAWTVSDIVWTSTPREEIDAIGVNDTRVTAAVDSSFRESLEGCALSDGEIELTDYRANRLTYSFSAPGEALAVFSEIWFPDGWQAYIDSEPVDHLRADYILRALRVPAGEHTIEFRFRAPGFARVEAVTLAFSLAIIAALAAGAVLTIKDRKRYVTSGQRQDQV